MLVNSFIVVVMALCGLILYFTTLHNMAAHTTVLLFILSCGFVYWGIYFWNRLSEHNARLKDKEWVRTQTQIKEIRRELAGPKKERRKIMWFKRNWQLMDKTILPSGFEQVESNIKSMSNLPRQFFRKTVILTFKCSITGKIKIRVIRS